MTGQILVTAKEIIDLGIEDPDLFMAMALFEDGFGCDHISDMTANVILADLLKWNARVLQEISVPTKGIELRLPTGKRYEAALPVNPYIQRKAPVILVPTDILRDLPIAADWSSVADEAAKNAYFRDRVNIDLAEIWRRKHKADLKRWALSGKEPSHRCGHQDSSQDGGEVPGCQGRQGLHRSEQGEKEVISWF